MCMYVHVHIIMFYNFSCDIWCACNRYVIPGTPVRTCCCTDTSYSDWGYWSTSFFHLLPWLLCAMGQQMGVTIVPWLTNKLQGAWAGASVDLAVNLWISVSSILYGKSPLEDNLPVGRSCEEGNITTTLMPTKVTYGVIEETPKYGYLILWNRMRIMIL